MRTSIRTLRRGVMAGALLLAGSGATPTAAAAQGAGSTGASVLQLMAGGRAAALSGAYTASSSDVDVLFYNPAGLGAINGGAALSYQRHVQDVGVASAAAAFRASRFVIGIGALFMDAGSISVLEPDPAFGGQTGRPTGATVGASELAARASLALPLLDGRLRLGAGAGIFTSTLADATQSAALFDGGVQYDVAMVTLAASVRNFGGPVTGDALADAELPSEARVGALVRLNAGTTFGGALSADIVSRIHEERTGFAVGVEAGARPGVLPQGAGAVVRVGYNAVEGEDALGRLQLGAGLTLGTFALDYAWQNYDFFGALHRFGVRWTRAR
jgi:hypothetical protein